MEFICKYNNNYGTEMVSDIEIYNEGYKKLIITPWQAPFHIAKHILVLQIYIVVLT